MDAKWEGSKQLVTLASSIIYIVGYVSCVQSAILNILCVSSLYVLMYLIR